MLDFRIDKLTQWQAKEELYWRYILANHSRGQPKGSLFNSYYTEV